MLLTDLLTLTYLNLWLIRKVHSFEKEICYLLRFDQNLLYERETPEPKHFSIILMLCCRTQSYGTGA